MGDLTNVSNNSRDWLRPGMRIATRMSLDTRRRRWLCSMVKRPLMLMLMRLVRTLFSRRKSLSLRAWKSLARMKRSKCRDGWKSCKSNRRASDLPVTWGIWNAQSVGIAKSRGRHLLGPRSWPCSLRLSPMMTTTTKTTYLSNEHSRVRGYLALTFKLPINLCGQIWAAPTKFGRKSSISTDNISAKKKILTNGLRNFVHHVKYCINTPSFWGYTLCGKNI